ncbi:hypothetical protein AB0F88_24475 [Streptosporangium sp. NPDC023963]|uniref:hypothetical protein n=1 Tax=Streptosporangium sp. NPDC023963 TaxID=3155608 RepID=UPI0034203E66
MLASAAAVHPLPSGIVQRAARETDRASRLDHVEKSWTGMRPRSLIARMDNAP